MPPDATGEFSGAAALLRGRLREQFATFVAASAALARTTASCARLLLDLHRTGRRRGQRGQGARAPAGAHVRRGRRGGGAGATGGEAEAGGGGSATGMVGGSVERVRIINVLCISRARPRFTHFEAPDVARPWPRTRVNVSSSIHGCILTVGQVATAPNLLISSRLPSPPSLPNRCCRSRTTPHGSAPIDGT